MPLISKIHMGTSKWVSDSIDSTNRQNYATRPANRSIKIFWSSAVSKCWDKSFDQSALTEGEELFKD